MAENITTEPTTEPRKFKDRKEYLEFIAEQKALKDKESKNSDSSRFEQFNPEEHVKVKNGNAPQKDFNDGLRSILNAVNINNKISNQILAKLNQKIVKESSEYSNKNKTNAKELLSEDPDKFQKIDVKINELKYNVTNLQKTAESIRLAVMEKTSDNIHESFRPIETNNVNNQQTKIIEKSPQYITNIRQYQYKRNPRYKTSNRRDGIVSGIGRRIGTHIGGRGLGDVIAKSIKIGERTTGAILKAPFKVVSKVAKVATGRTSRNELLKANRIAETSKFRKKMLDLLGIISKKDTQATTTQQTSSSNGLSNLLKVGGAAALAGGLASLIPSIKERFTKNEDGTFGPDHKGGIKHVKQLANNIADMVTKTLKSFGQGVKEVADKHLLEFAENNYKKFNEIKTKIEDFGKSILDAISNVINKAYEKVSSIAGKVADTAMEGANAVYNAPSNIANFATNAIKDTAIGEWAQQVKNKAVANNKMPSYKGGNTSELSNLTEKIIPNENYNNIASSLNKTTSTPTLKQLEAQQKQANDLQKERDNKALQPIVINSTNNTKESPKQPSMVRLGTRNLDSSKQQLDRSILTGGYVGVGFLVN